MNKKDLFASLREKTVIALLELLRLGQTEESSIDPDFLSCIIDELNSRELSKSESKDFEGLMNLFFNDDPTEKTDSKNEFSEEEIESITHDGIIIKEAPNYRKESETESGRYTALKTLIVLISLLGYLVIVVGFIGLNYLGSIEQGLIGFVVLVLSIVIALPLLAFSNLIYVFIDMEYNTRKTREEIKKLMK